MKNTTKLWQCNLYAIVIIAFIMFIAVSCDEPLSSDPAAPAITTASLPPGSVGAEYTATLAATGTMPITWSIDTGTLPAGLDLDAETGEISGTPTAAGTSNFTVKAENAIDNATKQLSIVINIAGNQAVCTHNVTAWTVAVAPPAFCTADEHSTGTATGTCTICQEPVTHTIHGGTESLTFTTVGSGATQTRRVSGITRTAVVCIPDFKDGYRVTSIATNVFGNSTSANADTVLTSIRIGGNVTALSDNAFYYCTNLESIELPDSLTSIGSLAFAHSGLKSITIPDSVTSSLNSTFRSCAALTTVVIGNNVPNIAGYAFRDCTSLANVTIGSSVTTIRTDAFRNTPALETIVIPNTVTQIWSFAFYGSGLKSITIPNSVLYFGNNSTDSISGDSGASVFGACPELTTVVIGNGLQRISNGAFANCPKLTNVTLSANLKVIGHQAFNETALTNINWPASLTNVGGAAFRNTKLTEVALPEGVTTIDYNSVYTGGTFANCTELTTVVLPSTIESIGSMAFLGSPALASLTVNAVTPPTLGNSAFGSTPPAALVIKVPAGSVDTYKATTNWSNANVANKIVAIE
ncbi:MAG: leucine-rich repeat protein [Treponema sp.]|nr:leucine-rich repeat protein [Treponema sp.]